MASTFLVIKRYHFYAAHRNETLAGKCANIHGHTYYLRVGLRLGQQNGNGVTLLFEDIDRLLEPVLQPFDHAFLLNRQDPIAPQLRALPCKLVELDGPTSAENLARYIYDGIAAQPGVPKGSLAYVDLQETTTSIVRYAGPAGVSTLMEPEAEF